SVRTIRVFERCRLALQHEDNFSNDCLVELNESQSRNDYHLVRQYRTPHHLVRFYFITRAYSSYVESILNDFRAALEADLVPDVVILHSCLWDLNRYHEAFPTEPPIPKAIREYRQNVEKLFQALDDVLPSSTLIIWNTAMAITKDARGYVIEVRRSMCWDSDIYPDLNHESCAKLLKHQASSQNRQN
ncbi:PC-esterase domain-containing protein 1B-like, partial [Pseudonaja textilis]|uniref:PC-esterase domain-containing protein 1B-like n=1 Tax=Pseudonaja textilis TaxID=8673 RepID=UPI000EA9AE8C